jgi:transcriptional regulator with GAF, ATPase, and Fis domain
VLPVVSAQSSRFANAVRVFNAGAAYYYLLPGYQEGDANSELSQSLTSLERMSMEKTVGWFRFCGGSRSIETAIRAGLYDAGILLVPFETSAEPYGIVCFEEVNEELFTFFHEARCRTRHRILALTVSQTLCSSLSWRLLHAGAADTLAWNEEGGVALQIRARLDRWRLIDELVADETARASIVCESPAWRVVVREVLEAARFTDAPILLTGESGTGKEMLARLVNSVDSHINPAARGGREHRELVTVDCGAVVPELSGSEFFGHERGAFTGAQNQREGAFALAHGGALLLDEIGDIPLPLQSQLLRAIQEKTYKRVGGNAWQSTQFRLVCATNRNLEEMIRQGLFRLDLYYRIAGCVFRTPPLRERIEDIIPLASHFLAAIYPYDTPQFDDTVREYLLNRPYPGNVRDLRQLVQRIAHRHVGTGPITPGDIPEGDRPVDGQLLRSWPNKQLEQTIADAIAIGTSLKEMSHKTIETAIRIAVQSESGNLQRAARRLGVTDRTLQIRRAAGRFSE